MGDRTDVILVVALAIAGLIFWRLHKRAIMQQNAAPPSPLSPNQASAAGAPSGTPFLALGQYAVPPENRWMLIQAGQQ